MEAVTAILTRRSIRKYKPDGVPEDIVRKVLECGFAAPTARNRRPLHFVLIKDSHALAELGSMHTFTTMAAGSAFSVLICADSALEERRQFMDQDGSAAAENMLLGAHAMGLGGVWCGIQEGGDREIAVRRICSLPESIIPIALMVFGIPDETREVPERYDAGKVHADRWRG